MPEQTVAYREAQGRLEVLEALETDSSASPLPCELLIPPGHYSYRGATYDFTAEGLYRLLRIPVANEQRIVFGGDVHELMRSLSWIHTHGSRDDQLATEDLAQAATTRKITTTCGALARFITQLLVPVGLHARMVLAFSEGPYNQFDDSHVLVEVLDPKLRRWVLYDIDNNVTMWRNGQQLDLEQFVAVIASGEGYHLERLARDSKIDASGFDDREGYSYAMYAELSVGSESALRKWYARVIRIAAIGPGPSFYARDTPAAARLAKVESYLGLLSEAEWRQRFYAR